MPRTASLSLFAILLISLLLHWPFEGTSTADRMQHDEIAGTVDFVVDGDTFHIGKHTIIRVWGINAPDKEHPYYLKSKLALQDMVAGQTITCLNMGVDQYDRILGVCYDEDGKNLSAQMVRGGHAWDFTRYSNGTYKAEERAARLDGLGLWASPERE